MNTVKEKNNFNKTYLKMVKQENEQSNEPTNSEETQLVTFQTSNKELIQVLTNGFEEAVFFVNDENDEIKEVSVSNDSISEVKISDVEAEPITQEDEAQVPQEDLATQEDDIPDDEPITQEDEAQVPQEDLATQEEVYQIPQEDLATQEEVYQIPQEDLVTQEDKDEDWWVRHSVAQNLNTDLETLKLLAKDERFHLLAKDETITESDQPKPQDWLEDGICVKCGKEECDGTCKCPKCGSQNCIGDCK